MQIVVTILFFISVHHNHVVHRDIKPANLLLGCDGRLRIADFGVSSEFHEAEDVVLENTVGTPAFHAPEVLCGDTFHGKAADIWAMGITLYFFVYGVLPFNDANILALHKLIQRQELRFPDENSISAQLKDLLVRLLCKDPNRRITLPEIKEHSWVTYDGTWQEEKDSCNIQRFANSVFDESSLRRVFSTLSIPYFSSFSRLVKTIYLKHSFQLPFGDN
jgi:[calcium/calmodulin-dependent protein kinase] kinase